MSDDERMSVDSYQTDATNNDSTFRSPNISMRGRKRKPVFHDDGSEVSFLSTPKRGRGRSGPGGGGGGISRPRAQRTPKTTTATPKKLANIDESALINVVKAGKGFDQVINRWINEYGGNRAAAIAKIIQLFLHSCGCRGVFHMMPEIDYPQVIRNMSDEFDEDCAEYPIIQSGPQWKKFRQFYETFLKSLINKCQGEIIFDNVFMDNVVQMLTGLADSHVRAFRHTATFAAMKISTALVDLVVKLVEIREKTNLQIETEKTKLKQRGTNQQLEVLLETKTMYDTKISDLSDMTSFLFKSIFVHRYRDIVPDIRCICITELGQWMSTHPAYFLEDTYLKYVGWLLYDKQPEVRVKCITALLPLFDDFECIEKLEVFLSRFKDRLVTMISDKDIDVAVKACQLLTMILKSFPNLLEPKDCVPIYEQVYSANKQLAVASGEFLNSKFFEASREGHNKALISDLILFYVEGEVHSHAAYLVDALLEISPIIKDWASMTEMLLSDECGQYDSALVEIMCAAIRQASTGEPPSGRALSKRAAKDLKQIQEDRTRISEVLIPTMARLLNRHIDDRDKIANLTTIPQYFNLELYPSARMMKCLDELIVSLQRIVEQHFDDEILSNIATTFLTFHNNIAVEQHISSARAQMIDQLVVALKRSLQLFQKDHFLDEQDEAQMLNGFRKINAFVATEDLRRNDLWDLTIYLLQNNDKITNPYISEKAIIHAFLTLSWDIQRLLKGAEPNADEAARRLKPKVDKFMDVIKHFLSSSATGVENAFLCLCDLLILLNWKVSSDFPDSEIANLEIILHKDFKDKINSFVVDNVFVSEENDPIHSFDQYQQIELLAKRRNLLSQFCKLIMHGVVPISDASLVLRYYVKYHTDYGDILKALLNKCREIDRIACASAISAALINSFEDLLLTTKGKFEPVDEDFIAIRDLAKRFALSFGPDATRNREAIATVHKLGIVHSLKTNATKKQLQKLAFLEVLIEFSPRLLRQDKQAVLKYLEKQKDDNHKNVDDEILGSNVAWQPYLLYRSSLQDKQAAGGHADDVGSVRSFAQPTGGRGGRRGPRRRVDTTPTPSEFSVS